jgi:hypothetical protein
MNYNYKEIHKQLERYTAVDEKVLIGHAKAADVQSNLHIDRTKKDDLRYS